MLEPGTKVGAYRIGEQLGAGTMGRVYRASRDADGAVVALKVMLPETARHESLRKRVYREARTAMAVNHPNIVRIHEVFEHEALPVLVMEYLEGESLRTRLKRERRIDLQTLAQVMVRVTSALGTAHAHGVIHRDIKPDNIFLARGSVKVLDFGIAKLTAVEGSAAATASLTKTGTLLGTPYYMSPEQAKGMKRIDHRSDIWSLGVTMYQCLSGEIPTRGKTFVEVFKRVVLEPLVPIEKLVPDVPADIAKLIGRMLTREPAGRPWDLREVHDALERHANEKAPSFATAVASVDEVTG